MSRHLLFVLLLATVVALADGRPQAQQTAGAAPAQAKTEAAPAQKEKAQTQTAKPQKKEAQAPTEPAAPPPAEKAPTQTVEAQTKTETAGRTQPAPPPTEAQKPAEEAQAPTGEDPKLTSVPGGKALGMSILGNQEAPKSLVIVPWKTSELGRSPDISPMLDDSRQPVDKEVFLRALRYYEIRSGTKQ